MPVAYHDGRFPPGVIDWPRLLPLIGPASAAIARYEQLLREIRPSSGRRAAVLCFPALLNIAEGVDAF